MDSFPLVSAVMPTRGRREYARIALECFRSQTYPNKELIIMDDEDNPSFSEPPAGIRYVRIAPGLNIPQKRNAVNAYASGPIIMHFDSDDWSAPERMSLQVKALLDSGKMMHGFKSILFWQVEEQQAWQYRHPDVYAIGTSQTYFKSWWERNPFIEKKSVGSDTSLSDATLKAKELAVSEGGKLMVARIHGRPGIDDGNTSHKSVGRGKAGTRAGCYRFLSREDIPEAFFAAEGIPA